jgi:hypothetical protein
MSETWTNSVIRDTLLGYVRALKYLKFGQTILRDTVFGYVRAFKCLKFGRTVFYETLCSDMCGRLNA